MRNAFLLFVASVCLVLLPGAKRVSEGFGLILFFVLTLFLLLAAWFDKNDAGE